MIKRNYRVNILVARLLCLLFITLYNSFSPLISIAQPAVQPEKQTISSAANQAMTPAAFKAAREEALREAKKIQLLLKQQFKVAKQEPASLNPYPKFVLHLSKDEILDPVDSTYQVIDAKPFDDKGFFREQKLLLITVDKIFLEARIKMGNRSTGIFALDGTKLVYLNGTDSIINVENILKRENRSLSEADPVMLANLFAMTILRQGNDRIDIIQSPDDILKLDKPNATKMNEIIKKKHFGRLYATTVDKTELEKCKTQISKPQLEGNEKSGWH